MEDDTDDTGDCASDHPIPCVAVDQHIGEAADAERVPDEVAESSDDKRCGGGDPGVLLKAERNSESEQEGADHEHGAVHGSTFLWCT